MSRRPRVDDANNPRVRNRSSSQVYPGETSSIAVSRERRSSIPQARLFPDAPFRPVLGKGAIHDPGQSHFSVNMQDRRSSLPQPPQQHSRKPGKCPSSLITNGCLSACPVPSHTPRHFRERRGSMPLSMQWFPLDAVIAQPRRFSAQNYGAYDPPCAQHGSYAVTQRTSAWHPSCGTKLSHVQYPPSTPKPPTKTSGPRQSYTPAKIRQRHLPYLGFSGARAPVQEARNVPARPVPRAIVSMDTPSQRREVPCIASSWQKSQQSPRREEARIILSQPERQRLPSRVPFHSRSDLYHPRESGVHRPETPSYPLQDLLDSHTPDTDQSDNKQVSLIGPPDDALACNVWEELDKMLLQMKAAEDPSNLRKNTDARASKEATSSKDYPSPSLAVVQAHGRFERASWTSEGPPLANLKTPPSESRISSSDTTSRNETCGFSRALSSAAPCSIDLHPDVALALQAFSNIPKLDFAPFDREENYTEGLPPTMQFNHHLSIRSVARNFHFS